MKSLRARLLTAVGLASLLLWGVVAWFSYAKALHEAGELLDGQLSQSAKLLLAQIRHEEDDLDEVAEHIEHLDGAPLHDYEQPLEFLIRAEDGRLRLRSEHAPALPVSAQQGYTDFQQDGRTWRVLTLRAAPYLVQVAQPTRDRDRAALEVATQMALPLLVGLPLLLTLLYLGVRAALRPLDDLARDVAKRTPENLTPLAATRTPKEVSPLLDALNTLLARLAATLENERRFTADAAHELRTPLAALKVQAQVALASGPGEDQQHALHQVLAGVDRAGRLVDQLLRLARLDPLGRLDQVRPVALATLLEEAATALAPQARARGQILQVRGPAAEATLPGDAELLRVALRNLLDNAIRHSPEGVEIELGGSADGPALWVSDGGPGVAPEELARLTERFYRGREVRAEGSGLGLAITRRIAELHGARLEFENLPGGGLRAMLDWGRGE